MQGMAKKDFQPETEAKSKAKYPRWLAAGGALVVLGAGAYLVLAEMSRTAGEPPLPPAIGDFDGAGSVTRDGGGPSAEQGQKP